MVWELEPLTSGELVKACGERLGWKKSTTYTVLKTLCDKGVLCNDNAVVSAAMPMEQVRRTQSEQFLQRTFGGSLPRLVASFLGDGKGVSQQELAELRELLDSYKEGE